MYQVKHLRYWSSGYEPEVDTYFFESKENAEKLVEAFKEHYGKEVATVVGCKYPIKCDSVHQRYVTIEKIEANDNDVDEMCSQVKRLGSTL